MSWNPFRLKFYVVRDKYHVRNNELKVAKMRMGISDCNQDIVDGPFESQEDAAHSLTFWRLQDEDRSRSLA